MKQTVTCQGDNVFDMNINLFRGVRLCKVSWFFDENKLYHQCVVKQERPLNVNVGREPHYNSLTWPMNFKFREVGSPTRTEPRTRKVLHSTSP